MKTATIKLFGNSYKVSLHTAKYANKTLAVYAKVIENNEPFCDISVNLPASVLLPKGAFYAKHWSENEGIPEQLIEQGVIQPINAPAVSSGFVDNIRAYTLT